MTGTPDPQIALGVQNTLATYAHALDDGRTDDIVALFTPDGVSDILGMGTFEGHDALRTAYSGLVPQQPQRHLVTNTVVTPTGTDEARADSDFILVLRGETGWAVQVVGKYQDVLRRDGGVWRFTSRKTSFAM
ncbi:nuclear transport factor 2 family protein [Nocardia carnea]|uniref:nuclear transport factor 2 family protein n=1 Tax=Nocardia carnea TaxID=37328 RepID=UPI00245680B4|nr:nuclear transport factor 2 family protein [Nocardia carnea]